MIESIAKLIASKMNDDQKRQMIQSFYDRHKSDPNIENLVLQMKNALGYTMDDVPKK